MTRPYVYRAEVLEHLLRHGLCPLPTTPPDLVRDALSDLYRYEIRTLRRHLLAGHIPRPEYAAHVIDLRRRYPLLSVPLPQWTAGADSTGGLDDCPR